MHLLERRVGHAGDGCDALPDAHLELAQRLCLALPGRLLPHSLRKRRLLRSLWQLSGVRATDMRVASARCGLDRCHLADQRRGGDDVRHGRQLLASVGVVLAPAGLRAVGGRCQRNGRTITCRAAQNSASMPPKGKVRTQDRLTIAADINYDYSM